MYPAASSRTGAVADAAAEADVGVGQHVQSLLRRDAREVADAERVAVVVPPFVALHVDPERHDGDAGGRNLQQLRHERRAVLADRDEAVDVAHLLPDQRDRLLPIRRRQAVQEELLALQRAADRPLQRLAAAAPPAR